MWMPSKSERLKSHGCTEEPIVVFWKKLGIAYNGYLQLQVNFYSRNDVLVMQLSGMPEI